MKYNTRFQSHWPGITPWLIAIFLLLPGDDAFSQSGRKQKKSEAQPPVQGVNQPDTRITPEPEVEPAKPKVTGPAVLIVSDTPDLGLPIYFSDIARQACAAELREAQLADLREAKNQNRADASKAAKNEDVYAVHLELRVDSLGQTSSNSRYQLDLRFTVYEPKTGKVILSGSGYPTQQQARTPVPIGYDYDQRQVELMGRDVGRRVLKILSEKAPRTPLLSSTTRG